MANQPYPSDPRYSQPDPNYAQSDPGYSQTTKPANPPAGSQTVRSSNANGTYMESQHANYIDPAGNQVENRTAVYEDRNAQRANARYWATTIIYFILGVLEIVLGLRFVFRLLGASENNGFITFLYGFSHIFIAPFNGIFNDQAVGTKSVFELSTLVAMLIYALICWGLVALARLVFSERYNTRQQVTTTRRNQF